MQVDTTPWWQNVDQYVILHCTLYTYFIMYVFFVFYVDLLFIQACAEFPDIK